MSHTVIIEAISLDWMIPYNREASLNEHLIDDVALNRLLKRAGK